MRKACQICYAARRLSWTCPLHPREGIDARLACGTYCLMQSSIQRAPSPLTYRIDALLVGQGLKELLEDTLAMVLVQPDDLAGVVIDDHGHVLVALAIRGFVHADADQPVQASLVGIGVQVLLCALLRIAPRCANRCA